MSQFGQTAFLHSLTLTPPSNSHNSIGMELMDSFQKLIKGVVCVADNKDWAILSRDSLAKPIGVKPKRSTTVPLLLVMQQNIGNLQKNSSYLKFVLLTYQVLKITLSFFSNSYSRTGKITKRLHNINLPSDQCTSFQSPVVLE